MEPQLEHYETTTLDWQALRALAVRAAQETPIPPAPGLGYLRTAEQFVDVCGPHWLLDYAFNRYDSPGSDPKEEEYEQHLYVLLLNGDLRLIRFTERSVTGRKADGQWWFRSQKEHSSAPMSDRQAEDFDFQRRASQQGVNWGDVLRAADSALLHESKGDGLRRLLEDLRTGRVRQRETLSPFDQDAGSRCTLPPLTDFHLTPDRRAQVLATVHQQQSKQAEVETRRAHVERRRESMKTVGKLQTLAGIVAVVGLLLGLWSLGLRSSRPDQWVEFTNFPWFMIALAMLVAWGILRWVKKTL